jgi:hypothetical protein
MPAPMRTPPTTQPIGPANINAIPSVIATLPTVPPTAAA